MSTQAHSSPIRSHPLSLVDLFTTGTKNLSKDPMHIKTTNDEIDKRLESSLDSWCQVETFDSFIFAMESKRMEQDGIPRDIPDITDIQYDVEVQKAYNSFTGVSGKEVNFYGPLCELANTILKTLTKGKPAFYFVRNDNHHLKVNDGDKGRKPDIIIVRKLPVGNTKLRWGDVSSVLEVKKGDTNVTGNTDQTGQAQLEPAVPRSEPTAPVPTLLGKREAENEEEESNKRPRTQENEDDSRNPTAAGTSEPAPAPAPTPAPAPAPEDEDEPAPEDEDEPAPGVETTRNQAIEKSNKRQILRYVADEISAIPTLRHVFNFYLSRTRLWVIYSDREQTISSQPLDIADPGFGLYKLIYTLNVYNNLRDKERGLFAKLETLPPKDNGPQATKLQILGGQSPGKEYIIGVNMSKTVERLIIGKHTRVMTVLMKKDPQGNLVPVTSEEFSTGTYGDPDKWEHVLKWSYPTKNRIHEADVLDSARRVLRVVDDDLAGSSRRSSKRHADSLPRVFDHLEIDDRDKLFRAFLEPNNYGERVLRFFVFERLDPITSLADLEEFKTAFRDIFHVIHYLAVSKDGIKHRDISISNLMCRRLENGKIQGVLNDWDVASTSHTESDSEHTNMRTGTMPFMSIDLHQHPPPVHMERFEYESLFYVLYWICLSYSDGKLLPAKKRHSIFADWPRWNSVNHNEVHDAKTGLQGNDKIFENVDEFPAMYRPLVQPWLECLRYQFDEGYHARRKYKPFKDDYTLGGYVSYESIRVILEN